MEASHAVCVACTGRRGTETGPGWPADPESTGAQLGTSKQPGQADSTASFESDLGI